MQHLCGTGLTYCKSVRYLDLFDVALGYDGMQQLEECLKLNITLKSVRLSNTRAPISIVSYFQKFLKTQLQIQCFRWINIIGLADQGKRDAQ